MYKNESIGVVVPAYNEANLVGETIESVPSYADRVYAIDDGSTDGTWQEIRKTAERVNERHGPEAVADGGRTEGPTVVPIQHRENKGVGAALKTGYRAALEDEVDVVIVMNGDKQMDPGVMPRLLDPIVEGRAEFTQGDRLSRRENFARMSRWRLFGNCLLTLLTRFSSGYWGLLDPQNGYTAISVDALEEMDIDSLYDDYGFLNDLLTALNLQNARIVNVPHEAIYGDEESSIAYNRFVPKLSGLLLRNFLFRLASRASDRRYVPAVACYALGALGVVTTVVSAAFSLTGRGEEERVTSSAATFSVAVLVFLLGIAFDARASKPLETPYED